jgi:hypothetical protein
MNHNKTLRDKVKFRFQKYRFTMGNLKYVLPVLFLLGLAASYQNCSQTGLNLGSSSKSKKDLRLLPFLLEDAAIEACYSCRTFNCCTYERNGTFENVTCGYYNTSGSCGDNGGNSNVTVVTVDGGGGSGGNPIHPDPCQPAIVGYLDPGQTYPGTNLKCEARPGVSKCMVLKNGDKLSLRVSAVNVFTPTARSQEIKDNIKAAVLTSATAQYGTVFGTLLGKAVNSMVQETYELFTMPFNFDQRSQMAKGDEFKFIIGVAMMASNFYGGGGASRGTQYIDDLARKISSDPVLAHKILSEITRISGEIWGAIPDSCTNHACESGLQAILHGFRPEVRDVQVWLGDHFAYRHTILDVYYKDRFVGIMDNSDFITGMSGDTYARNGYIDKVSGAIRDAVWKEKKIALSADIKNDVNVITKVEPDFQKWRADTIANNEFYIRNSKLVPALLMPGGCK